MKAPETKPITRSDLEKAAALFQRRDELRAAIGGLQSGKNARLRLEVSANTPFKTVVLELKSVSVFESLVMLLAVECDLVETEIEKLGVKP